MPWTSNAVVWRFWNIDFSNVRETYARSEDALTRASRMAKDVECLDIDLEDFWN